MTKAQIRRLEQIIAKLERLEADVKIGEARDYLSDAKSALLSAYRVG